MKKTLIALTAIVTLAGLANADVIRSETPTLSSANQVMTVEAAQACWQEQMEKLFTDFEPEYKGTPLWAVKADLDPFTTCEMPTAGI